MAFTIPEALKLAQNPMLQLIYRSIVTTDEMAALIPMMPVDGTSIKVPREGTLPSTAWIVDAGTATEESAGTDDVPEVQFRRLVGNIDRDELAAAVGGAQATSLNRLVAKKAKATWREIKATMINGGNVTSHVISPAITAIGTGTGTDGLAYGPHLDSSRRGPGSIKISNVVATVSCDVQFRAPGDVAYGPVVSFAADGTKTVRSWNESFYVDVTIDVSDIGASGEEALVTFASSTNDFDGLSNLVDPALETSGTVAFGLGVLDALMSQQKVRENRAFIMNSAQIENVYAAYRALGGTSPQNVVLQGYNAAVPTYRGVPILQNDNIVASGGESDIYLTSFAEEGIALAVASAGSSPFTPDADPRTRPVAGFRIQDVGLLEGKDARRTRVAWTGALVAKSHLATAVRRNVTE